MARPESKLWQWRPRLFVRLDGFDPAQDSTCKGPRGKIGTGHEAHQRAEAPGGGGTQEMKAIKGRLVAIVEYGIAVDHSYGFQQRRGKEGILGNVHAVAGGHEDMVHLTRGAVV